MLDVTMTDNRSDYAGAAIDAGGSVDVTLQSVTLTDNQVTKSGGAVDIGSSSTLSLSESVIRENDADGVSLGLGASIVCKTSNLDQNEGAGINRLFDDVDTIVLTDCSFGELDTSEVNSEGAILDNGMAVTLGNHETMTL